MKKIVIFNQKVAGYLMLRSFTLKQIKKNDKNDKMNVFIFNDTDELRLAISQYDDYVLSTKDM